jgi:hypothetical protein
MRSGSRRQIDEIDSLGGATEFFLDDRPAAPCQRIGHDQWRPLTRSRFACRNFSSRCGDRDPANPRCWLLQFTAAGVDWADPRSAVGIADCRQ